MRHRATGVIITPRLWERQTVINRVGPDSLYKENTIKTPTNKAMQLIYFYIRPTIYRERFTNKNTVYILFNFGIKNRAFFNIKLKNKNTEKRNRMWFITVQLWIKSTLNTANTEMVIEMSIHIIIIKESKGNYRTGKQKIKCDLRLDNQVIVKNK